MISVYFGLVVEGLSFVLCDDRSHCWARILAAPPAANGISQTSADATTRQSDCVIAFVTDYSFLSVKASAQHWSQTDWPEGKAAISLCNF